MKYFNGEQFRTAFFALPTVAQDVICADDTREKMEAVYLACNVPKEKSNDLSYLFDTVLYALVPWEEVESEIRAILSCSPSVAHDIAERMKQAIFMPIEDVLHKAHGLLPDHVRKHFTTPQEHRAEDKGEDEKDSEEVLPSSPFTSFLESGVPAVRFKKLPPSVREKILSQEVGEALHATISTRPLTEEQKTTLVRHVFGVLSGETAVRVFKESVAKDIPLPAPVLDALFSEIEEKVFRPVRMTILALLERKEEGA
jgi:hypothetical protein